MPSAAENDSAVQKSIASTSAILSEKTLSFGTHLFKISYSQTKNAPPGSYFTSPPFAVGGELFVIWYYPAGKDETSPEYISLYLSSCREHAVTTAFFELAVVDEHGKPSPTWRFSTAYKFVGKSSWGRHKFIRREDFELMILSGGGDCFAVVCDITVVDAVQSDVAVPPSTVHSFLPNLYDDGADMADVTIEVDGGAEFRAHKLVLAARSPVFKAAFYGSMAESRRDRMSISDVRPPEFSALLHYIYTDTVVLPGDAGAAAGLLEAADRFGLDRLRLICEKKLFDGITVETAAATLELAERHCCGGLHALCLNFMARPVNFYRVLETDGFRRLEESCPAAVAELRRKFAGEPPASLSLSRS